MTNYKKILYILGFSLLCLTICSCNSGKNKKACKTVEQIVQAAGSDNNDLFKELAPFSKNLNSEEYSATISFWKTISETKYKISFETKTDDSYFVKVDLFTTYNTISDSYIFECKSNSDDSFYLCPEYKIDSKKRTIDYIELKDLTD